MKIRNHASAALLVVALTSPALAWGPDGHRIVAQIAQERLTAKARADLKALLPPGDRISDNYVANWPDYIRHDNPETANWHYTDIPYEATAYDAARDCVDGQCIVDAIGRLEKVLADPKIDSQDRNEALRFVVHFLGDLHQPLHCISRDNDRGGNDVVVRYPGNPKDTNLHSVWDLELVRANVGTNGPLPYAEVLNARITPGQEKRWVKGAPADWAWESHDVAVRHVYVGVPPAGSLSYEIPAPYISANRRVVERQLMKAGVRLATVLNHVLN